MTLPQVVNEVFDAIAGTLYDKQKLDPSIVSNARSEGLYKYRPTRSSSDAGRIGVEIDGAEFMFSSRISPNKARRIFSLTLAAKLSCDVSWKEYESQENGTMSCRPVALCYNTIKEALAARQQMQFLQQHCRSERERRAFDHVIIQTLSDGVPKDLHATKPEGRRNRSLQNLSVNATKGVLVVVQPTDFNRDFDPARPSLHSLKDFQKTVACALVQETPVVVISPRFLSYGENEAPDNHINQNGFQQASFYGGTEPPRGPPPFILRDFSPPSYCWIGDALSVASAEEYANASPTRIILTNSVMDEDHPWHMYASSMHRTTNSMTNNEINHTPNSVYLASTRSTSGRPTRALMNRILLGSNLNGNDF